MMEMRVDIEMCEKVALEGNMYVRGLAQPGLVRSRFSAVEPGCAGEPAESCVAICIVEYEKDG